MACSTELMQKLSPQDYLPQVPSGEAETQALIRDTRAVTVLEVEYAASLDFGGISTDTVRGLRAMYEDKPTVLQLL